MNVFQLRDHLIERYRQYVTGFVQVRESDAREAVRRHFDSGRLWPEALVQLNPAFQSGRTVDALANDGTLHPECARIFRRRDVPGDPGRPLHLHWHQEEGIAAAETGASYVLTTGTGSGKSLAYFIPIVDTILRAGSGNGVKAIAVYPMNALCNSQYEALEHFITWAYPNQQAPVRFARYTGQERRTEREQIIASRPDIILTNYVMLELMLTRVEERQLVEQFRGLEFLVLDELHTYRGRQGADVAMLVRRLRERCGATGMRCIGTSATLAGEGSWPQRQRQVAELTSVLFGQRVDPAKVIGETLRRATTGAMPDNATLAAAVRATEPFGTDYATLARQPLAVWSERAFGLEEVDGRLERRVPRTLSAVAVELAQHTGVADRECAERLQALLLAGCQVTDPETDAPLFAFRLHQFISRGDALYATLEPPGTRYLSTSGQVYVPEDRSRQLFPTAFCRECGEDFLLVRLADTKEGLKVVSRPLNDLESEGSGEAGCLIVKKEGLPEDLCDLNILPEEWIEVGNGGRRTARQAARQRLPRLLTVYPDGRVKPGRQDDGYAAWFLPGLFRFCPSCGVTYTSTREREFTRLAQLSSEGRSTATTVISLALVQALRADETLPAEARKLLSFTDNRQDASLQAGHFDDFVEVTLLRCAILAAVSAAGSQGIKPTDIAGEVTVALQLDFPDYAANTEVAGLRRQSTDEALRDVIGYRVYHDLRRGWRINSPNLEATGLLRIVYDGLEELCAEEASWAGTHSLLEAASPANRVEVCRKVLDFMRRSLAIKVRYLDAGQLDKIKGASYNWLKAPWALDEDEQLTAARVLETDPGAHYREAEVVRLTPRSRLGQLLRLQGTWSSVSPDRRLSESAVPELVAALLRVLRQAAFVDLAPGSSSAYLLQSGVMRWLPGDGRPSVDATRTVRSGEGDRRAHLFFQELYRAGARALHGLQAREHTAQVPSDVRQEREEQFSTGGLPVLYCSPTMELGVDIRQLNVVNLRNVPPTPANYAQRSGRAGRSGQPALVITYCTTGSAHDQYYFRRKEEMVAGAVAPPRIDLANEELLRAHVHAVWLAATGQSLYSSVHQLIDLTDEERLPLKEEILEFLETPRFVEAAAVSCRSIWNGLTPYLEPERAPWYHEGWLEDLLRRAPAAFNQAVDHWRHLYRSARSQRDTQHAIIVNTQSTREERDVAERLRREAEAQLALLTSTEHNSSDDFYSYRYFASEGFLPGYNFPRLPVSAYISGRRQKRGDEYLSRPRFIALSEFGPRALIYYEGSRYRVTRVMIRRGDDVSATGTIQATACESCGYAMFGPDQQLDHCPHCDAEMAGSNRLPLPSLLRLESVSTQRADRITCDEEERVRQGYEMRTLFRFEERGAPSKLPVTYRDGNGVVADAEYAPATNLYRVNLGWRRRRDRQELGFTIDVQRGIWSRSEVDSDDNQETVRANGRAVLQRVVPFVNDHRNALLLRLRTPLRREAMLSLQYALKRGIESLYQLEESELAVEPLPAVDAPTRLLFYEAAEGGAGVLIRLAQEPEALARVAQKALQICHCDPKTGEDDPGRMPDGEPCGVACYDCLLSYQNQSLHDVLDRRAIVETLLQLSGVRAETGAGERSRDEQLKWLLGLCESELERSFLRWLATGGYRLPDRAQPRFEQAPVRPDFLYEESWVAVYIDGYHHQFPDRRARDAEQTGMLEELGYMVVRAGGPESWPEAVSRHPDVFGPGKETA